MSPRGEGAWPESVAGPLATRFSIQSQPAFSGSPIWGSVRWSQESRCKYIVYIRKSQLRISDGFSLRPVEPIGHITSKSTGENTIFPVIKPINPQKPVMGIRIPIVRSPFRRLSREYWAYGALRLRRNCAGGQPNSRLNARLNAASEP